MSRDISFMVMRLLGTLLSMTLIAAAVFAAEPGQREAVTAAQLEQQFAGAAQQQDRDIAQRIARMQLTQRVSAARAQRMIVLLPGEKSREALTALADVSQFLDLPEEEVPRDAAPDKAAQKQMLSRTVDYVAATIHRLPDFLVMRHLTRFEDLEVKRGLDEPVSVRARGFERKDRSTAKVVFREGREVVQPKSGQEPLRQPGLTDYGIFGTLLGVVMADVLNGRAGFDHWEAGPNGRVAVFRYVVNERISHYSVNYCCYYGREGMLRSFHATPQYHGELAIDPETGAILRLVLKTDLNENPPLHVDPDTDKPLQRADVAVEYGPIEIGGSRYIVPLRSVSVQTSWTGGSLVQADGEGHTRPKASSPLDQAEYTRVTAINDYLFDEHHLFRGDMRIVRDVAPKKP
jgi:hypothetical protein